MVFATVELCEKNYKELQHKKLKERTIYVDYAGEKSTYVKKDKPDKNTGEKPKDLKRLHISGFDKDVKEDQIKVLFSNFSNFTLPVKHDGSGNMA